MNADMAELSLQVDDWIDKYICKPADLTVVDFYLEYLNTNNFKFYINLVRKVESVKLRDKKFIVNWFYEDGDEDIIEKGEAMSSSLDIPFNFILISDYRYIDTSPSPAPDI